MAWAFIDKGSGNVPNGNASADVTATLSTLAADVIWAGVACYQGSASYPTISDNHSGSWSGGIRADGEGGNRHLIVWYQFSPAQDASFVVTFVHGGENYASGGAMSFSGSSGVFGAQVPSSSGALGTMSGGGRYATLADASSVQASEDGMLYVSACGSDGGFGHVYDPASGATWATTATSVPIVNIDTSSGNHVGFSCSYRVLGGSTSGNKYGVMYDAVSETFANEAAISVMSFKPSGGSGGATAFPHLYYAQQHRRAR